ncbi:hypothetical protein BU16DRAFT_523379 [Lophium mytilinum]|uniref:RRM domain-containing protein n=1 Tax=Lophium mytilinum TaxID=390894 RepID=A0A6A6R9X6_9PEZI|nr:hypothetical protein BU16DRAFT_523379 [Lophium mytilinum]
MPTPPALTRPSKARSVSTNTSAPPPAAIDSKTTEESARTRLHITPFTAELLKSYIPPTVLPSATNISFHTVETFPEKGFGYIELPTMEAQKLKKKLNGSILKGSKVRIEEAKPEKRKKAEKDGAVAKEEDRPAKRPKKEKRTQNVMEGIELPDQRKIKRGWTEVPGHGKNKADKKSKKDKKEKAKESQYLKEPEMLFKAKLTPAAAAAESAVKAKKSKAEGKEKKISKANRDVVVHEFTKTSKHPSFLKSSEAISENKPATEYINGKGWVDEDGNVVEAETGKARRARLVGLAEATPEENTPKPAKGVSSRKNLSASSMDIPDIATKTKSKSKTAKKSKQATPPSESSDETSDSSSAVSSESSDSESDSGSESVASDSQASSSSISSSVPTKPLQNITLTPPSPLAEAEISTKEVHPLEALFKRPKPPTITTAATTPLRLAPITTSFSFFDGDANEVQDEDGDTSMKDPHTPFTRQDLDWRGLRSAAPTPDTAAIGRKFSFPWGRDNSEEEDEDDVDAGAELKVNTRANAALHAVNEEDMDAEVDANVTPLGRKAAREGETEGQGEEESEFSKWFWEHRGENNRAWKKRRRDALKVERQRENRRTGRKVV